MFIHTPKEAKAIFERIQHRLAGERNEVYTPRRVNQHTGKISIRIRELLEAGRSPSMIIASGYNASMVYRVKKENKL